MEHLNRIELKGRVGTVRTNEVNGTKVVNFSLVSDSFTKPEKELLQQRPHGSI